MKYLSLAGFVALCFLPAALGSRFGPGPWYAALAKPSWNPPNSIFGPVWTALYLLMAVAAWFVWSRRGWGLPLDLFLVQLFFNAIWTWLFFGLKSPALAFADILLLWLAIAVTAFSFWQARPLAGLLLAPYLAWVTFASALNFAIWRLNR